MDNPLFEASYCRLFCTDIVGIVGEDPAVEAFFEEFYRRFLRDEEVAALFANTDMTHQVSMLKHSLFQLTSCWVLGRPSAELVRLAELHQRLGIATDVLDRWLEALLVTIEHNDPLFDDATRLAWCWALAPGLFYMKSFLGGDATPAKAGGDEHLPPHWQSGAYDPAGPTVRESQ